MPRWQYGRLVPDGDDWMAGGVVENDREEARSARLAAERDNDPHPQDCRCRPCCIDQSGLQPGQKET